MHGGAIYIVQSKEVKMGNNLKIEKCSAGLSGGGVFLQDIQVIKMERCFFLNNMADLGGGIYVNGKINLFRL